MKKLETLVETDLFDCAVITKSGWLRTVLTVIGIGPDDEMKSQWWPIAVALRWRGHAVLHDYIVKMIKLTADRFSDDGKNMPIGYVLEGVFEAAKARRLIRKYDVDPRAKIAVGDQFRIRLGELTLDEVLPPASPRRRT
jgi:hypothetical protein